MVTNAEPRFTGVNTLELMHNAALEIRNIMAAVRVIAQRIEVANFEDGVEALNVDNQISGVEEDLRSKVSGVIAEASFILPRFGSITDFLTIQPNLSAFEPGQTVSDEMRFSESSASEISEALKSSCDFVLEALSELKGRYIELNKARDETTKDGPSEDTTLKQVELALMQPTMEVLDKGAKQAKSAISNGITSNLGRPSFPAQRLVDEAVNAALPRRFISFKKASEPHISNDGQYLVAYIDLLEDKDARKLSAHVRALGGDVRRDNKEQHTRVRLPVEKWNERYAKFAAYMKAKHKNEQALLEIADARKQFEMKSAELGRRPNEIAQVELKVAESKLKTAELLAALSKVEARIAAAELSARRADQETAKNETEKLDLTKQVAFAELELDAARKLLDFVKHDKAHADMLPRLVEKRDGLHDRCKCIVADRSLPEDLEDYNWWEHLEEDDEHAEKREILLENVDLHQGYPEMRHTDALILLSSLRYTLGEARLKMASKKLDLSLALDGHDNAEELVEKLIKPLKENIILAANAVELRAKQVELFKTALRYAELEEEIDDAQDNLEEAREVEAAGTAGDDPSLLGPEVYEAELADKRPRLATLREKLIPLSAEEDALRGVHFSNREDVMREYIQYDLEASRTIDELLSASAHSPDTLATLLNYRIHTLGYVLNNPAFNSALFRYASIEDALDYDNIVDRGLEAIHQAQQNAMAHMEEAGYLDELNETHFGGPIDVNLLCDDEALRYQE